MKRQNALVQGVSMLYILGFGVGFLFCNTLKTSETVQEELSLSNNEAATVVYVEVPYIYYDEEFEQETRERAYNDYMAKLTDDNAEAWWGGYQIMMQDAEDPPVQLKDVYSETELYYLYSCVETEVFGGDFLSKAHIAMVIFNRLDDPDKIWGETIQEIITKPNQFAYGAHPISQQTIQACEFAFVMQDMTQGAVSFHSGGKTKTFNGREYIFTDAVGHHFY